MFDVFYSQYVAERAALGVTLLAPAQLIALIGALLDRATAAIH